MSLRRPTPAVSGVLSILLVLPAVLVLSNVRADVVHLKNWGRIEGEVLEDDEDGVVVKTGAGKMEIPRERVERVEKESRAATLLRRAKVAARGGDRARAIRLAEKALAEGDARVRRQAESLLAELRARADAPEPTPTPRAAGPRSRRDPFSEDEPEALLRELGERAARDPQARTQLAQLLLARAVRRAEADELRLAISDLRRARALVAERDAAELLRNENALRLTLAGRSLRRRNGALLARQAAEPVAKDPTAPPRVHRRAQFLFGRAAERLHQEPIARAAYLEVLGGLKLPANRDLATHRELARQAAAGIPVTAESPGVAPGWSWKTSRHFAVLHQAFEGAQTLTQRLEKARADVITRLSLRSKLDESERIVVFVFATSEGYRGSAGARAWSGGHASRLRTEDDLIRAIFLFPEPGFERVLRHEVAHILVGDALEDSVLPGWASEGVATYAEPELARHRWREQARLLHASARLPDTAEALGRMLPDYGAETNRDVLRFYTHAALLFSVLAERTSVEKALDVGLAINTEGAEGALRTIRVGLRTYEGWVRSAVERR